MTLKLKKKFTINMNMFHIFDPNIKLFPMNFMFMFLMILMNKKFWKMNNFLKFIYIKNKTINNLFNSMIMLILTLNLMNIMPKMFSPSNNIMFTLNLTLLMWIMTLNLSLINNYNILFMNLSPKSTMLTLIQIINLIELNSFLFLIMSLSMRLMINMMMGHIIISMLKMNIMIYIYMMIELMIIFIQSYVFMILNLINFNNMN